MNFKLKRRLRNLANRSITLKKIYYLANKIKVSRLSDLSDYEYAKMKYKENTGRVLNLENPKTFNEKIWWLKINNREPLLTICSDKYMVRTYVKEKGLDKTLIPLIGVYDSPDEIKFDELPDKAFIKLNNASGINALWKKENFDKKYFIKKFKAAMKENYYYQSREYNYKDIEPKIIVEKFIEEETNDSIVDNIFLCLERK